MLAKPISHSLSKRLALCLLAAAWASLAVAQPKTDFSKGKFAVERIKGLNSNADEIYPRINDRGDFLYFTRQGHPDNSKVSPTGQDLSTLDPFMRDAYSDLPDPSADQDIWVARMVGGQVAKVGHPPYPLNSTKPNTITCILPGKGQCVVQNQLLNPPTNQAANFAICQLLTNGMWTGGVPIIIDNYRPLMGYNKVHFYTNGSVGLLSVNLGDGEGKNDLYVTQHLNGTRWSRPVNLGHNVNSPGMDMSPYLATDLRTLYFTSDRNGQSDIYVSRRNGDGWANWSTPEKLPAPINSAGNDRDPCIDPSGKFLYFSSNRDGNFDLFRVRLSEENKAATVALVRVQTINVLTNKPVGGTVRIAVQRKDASEMTPTQAGLKNLPSEIQTDPETGSAELRLPIGKAYAFAASKAGYLSASGVASLESDTGYRELTLTLPLTPVAKPDTPKVTPTLPKVEPPPLKLNTEKGAVTLINSILFKVGTADFLSSDSYPQMDQLAEELKKAPNISLEIQGHTDNQGMPAVLQSLSQRRAEEVRKYLIKKGIAPERLVSKGYGGSQPAFDNKDEKLRAKNRRVEVKVL